jgi:hypothetical protein
MTTLPIHTVQHLKSVHKKYQVIAIVFTVITLVAALLAAISGFQSAKLHKMQVAELQKPPAQVAPVAVPADNGLEKQVKILEGQLNSEKMTSRELRAKVHELEKKVASMKTVAPSQARPAPVKPKVPAVAPTVEAPRPAKPAAKSPKAPAPAVPEAVSKPPKAPVPAEKTAPQVETNMQKPESGSTMTGKPAESSGSPTSTPPEAPAVERNQPMHDSVSPAAPTASPEGTPAPATSSEGGQPAAPEKVSGANKVPGGSPEKSSMESNSGSQTGAGVESNSPASHPTKDETTAPVQSSGSENP